jgi:hypothetical protein
MWRGKKHEDRHTQVALLVQESLAANHSFFTSSDYTEFHRVIQPATNVRRIDRQNHALIDATDIDDTVYLPRTLESPAIEVALNKVVEGGVAEYYSQLRKNYGPYSR